MAKKKPRSRSTRRPTTTSVTERPIVYIHGIGKQLECEELKLRWDLALFGRELSEQSRMAHWADILHPQGGSAGTSAKSLRTGEIDVDETLASAGLDPDDKRARDMAHELLRQLGVAEAADARKKILPLPAFLRRPIARVFLKAFVGDTAAYFFRPEKREEIRARLIDALPPEGTPFTLVAHSQGTIVAYEVLTQLGKSHGPVDLVTLGSPLGIREIQDFIAKEVGPKRGALRIPLSVARWHNFADPLDPVAADKGLKGDFVPQKDSKLEVEDRIVLNTTAQKLLGYNPHLAIGYLSHPDVRAAVRRSMRFDTMARFVMARDVAETLATGALELYADELGKDQAQEPRHPVLVEILEPQYPALGETRSEMATVEAEEKPEGALTLEERIERAAAELEGIVGAKNREAARIDTLRRFVAAHLTPAELSTVAAKHRDLRVYAVWKSSVKRKLLDRSMRAMKVDAALASYTADGAGITWAVLDTGACLKHPHFATHGTIAAAWDCTKRGRPRRIDLDDDEARDRDGHGTHVAGIIAGEGTWHSENGDETTVRGIAPKAKLVVYRVLDDQGAGEDAWIIKALDHIAEQNENQVGRLAIHGVNLSLGGAFDSSVYGCGFSPICAELRRLWRAGVLVCVASGNEGKVEVTTAEGELELNSPMSIGDPANLEECVAVGSVNADRPHTYGISSFSSRGPTSDGRAKPDVVAPGERILSCNSSFDRRRKKPTDAYIRESGTSMAAPHVSGLLAAFLSVRREFCGRPDDVKRILLDCCIDIGRDRYHQGHGIPNLMKMLTEV